MKAKLVVEGKEFPIEINDPELEKLIAQPKKTGYELVKDGHTYSFVNSYGEVMTIDHKDDDDDNRYCDANYYSSPIVAENNARADKLMRQLRRFAVENRKQEIDWAVNCTKYEICYDNFTGEMKCLPTHNYTQYLFCPYFDSEDSAELAMKAYHDELIWYFTEYKDSL